MILYVKATVKGASAIVIREVMSFWEMARIPVMAIYNAMSKVVKKYEKWYALLKGSYPQSTLQVEKKRAITDELDNSFDIAHANELGPPTLAEDQEFLLAQHEKGRTGFELRYPSIQTVSATMTVHRQRTISYS